MQTTKKDYQQLNTINQTEILDMQSLTKIAYLLRKFVVFALIWDVVLIILLSFRYLKLMQDND